MSKVELSEETKTYGAITVTTGSYIAEMSRKCIRGTDISTSLISHLDINVALPGVNIDQWEWSSAFIDWLLSVDP